MDIAISAGGKDCDTREIEVRVLAGLQAFQN